MTRPAIHFLGAGELQVPLLQWARSVGIYVYASDVRPDAEALHLADEILPSHNATPEGVTRYCGSDWGVQCLSKPTMKQELQRWGLPTPRYLGGPFVVKPRDGSGSVGVHRYNAHIAERYIEGRSIDANGVFVDGKLYGAGIFEKFPNEHFLPTRGHELIDEEYPNAETVYAWLNLACNACRYTDGPVKGDFLVTQDSLTILEVSPRFHGDVMTTHAAPQGSGINGPRLWFRWLADGEIAKEWLAPIAGLVGAWRVIPEGAEVEENEYITKVWYKPTSEHHDRNTNGIRGYVCARGETANEAHQHIRRALI